jgi:prepilin signal peptidase PulO-like enzyme (type II secretory pathway)
MGYDLIIAILAGAIAGISMKFLTHRLIQKRTGQPAEGLLINRRWSWIIWLMAGALGCGVISLMTADLISSLEFMAVYLVLISLSVVDGKIRKIPNELLLALLLIRMGAFILQKDLTGFLPALVGMFFGYFLFLVPAQFGISIGWGDIKLAAVAGFFLGILGLFQAVMIMAAVMGIYGLVLIITRRGNLKTKVAMGPPLSLGLLVSMILPIAWKFLV